jgi:hypothetical protein
VDKIATAARREKRGVILDSTSGLPWGERVADDVMAEAASVREGVMKFGVWPAARAARRRGDLDSRRSRGTT